MRPGLVVTGAALILVGVFLASVSWVVPTTQSYNFGPFGWSETRTQTVNAFAPVSVVLFFLGFVFLVLGAVLRSPDRVITPAAVYYVPAPPPGAPPGVPLVAPVPPAAPARPAPPAATAPPAFATPLPGSRAPPATRPPATRPPVSAPAVTAAPPSVAAPAPRPAPLQPAATVLPSAHAAASHEAALVAGARVLDKFEVLRGLGQGTFGGTYLARDLILDRPVVLKELLPQWRDDPDASARFVKEAKIVGSLRHPNVVDLFGVERWGSGLLLVMEYADGGSLAQVIRERGRLVEKEAVRVADQVLAALEAVHARGILHRDVKPSNILLTRANEVRLADFGIAYAPTYGATVAERPAGTSHPGSLPFMAPEQVEGRELDARADLYAVGATLYYVVVGAPYVDLSGKTQESMRRTVLESPPRLPVEGLSAEMNALLAKSLAKRPQDRFASASEMRKWLPR